jgi:hypothetical protein
MINKILAVICLLLEMFIKLKICVSLLVLLFLLWLHLSLLRACIYDRRSIPGRGEIISPLAYMFRQALRPTQPPVQWVPGDLSPGLKRGRGVMLTTHPHLVPRLRMSRTYTSFPPKRLRGV